ncbi:hypothetical protein [Thiohalocapsa sp. ML1]|uniref:hypothetical protein n=1 Tax=Thiohalocapsa sp. ML1 TaxID=1431688 RepID=UPI000732086E|nr:hypothetical protein [Thiohalocapsa sp. ML1]
MLDLQTIVSTLMTLLLYGGADAAKELINGVVVNGATEASKTWRALMRKEPEAYPLADRVAQDPDNDAAASELRILLERVLTEHPELRPTGDITVTAGDIKADHGSVAAGVVTGNITINNK